MKTGWKGVEWIYLAWGREKWRATKEDDSEIFGSIKLVAFVTG